MHLIELRDVGATCEIMQRATYGLISTFAFDCKQWFFVFQNAPHLFSYGVFLAGLCIVAQFSYFGEYLPKVFPVHLRGTGSAFATNVGGRMIGTSAAFLTTNLIAPMLTIGSNNFEKVAYAAGITGVLVFAIGFVTSFFLLEPKAEGSPE